MKTFDQVSLNGKCDCCGKENIKVAVLSSRIGPISLSYCKECASNGYEPYSGIVAMASTAVGDGNEDSYKDLLTTGRIKFIDRNLRFHNKTEEQFIADMKELNRRCLMGFLEEVEEVSNQDYEN